jgi:GNAT superfamily N-acetyltransferase
MRIRAAVETDIPQLLSLVRRYWQFEGLGGFEALRMELLLKRLLTQSSLGEIWVAEENAQLNAYLVLVYVLSLEHQGLMAEVDEFFVLPQARGQGVGSELLATAEEVLRRRGCVRVQLQLALSNEAARRFYLDRGYCGRTGYELIDKAL